MIKRISVKQLRIGMFVTGSDRKWINWPFFRRDFLIASAKEIAVLQDYCGFVYIDVEKGVDVEDLAELETFVEQTNEHELVDTDISHHEIQNFFEITYAESKLTFNEVLDDINHGRGIDISKIRAVVQDLLACMDKDSQAMVELVRLRDQRDVLVRKSVNVCILALAFGKHKGLSNDKLTILGMGALLHDIGMAKIPQDILLSTEPLTSEQRTIIEKHTEYGLGLLSAKKADMPREVLQIVYSHHERMDGNGYPQHLQGNHIGLLVRMVSIASVYEALTRDRSYGETLSPVTALRYLYAAGDSIVDAQLVEQFIIALHIYPADYVVELASGELCVVANITPYELSRPILHIVTDSKKQLLQHEQVVDLQDPANRDVKIVKILETDDPIVELIMSIHQQAKETCS